MESLLTQQRMDEITKYWTVKAMQEYGGSFVKNLGAALQSADAYNTLRIQQAFPDYIEQYMDIGLKMKKNEE